TAGNSKAHDDTPDWTCDAEKQHGQAHAPVGGLGVYDRLSHVVLVEVRQLLTDVKETANCMALGQSLRPIHLCGGEGLRQRANRSNRRSDHLSMEEFSEQVDFSGPANARSFLLFQKGQPAFEKLILRFDCFDEFLFPRPRTCCFLDG